MSTVAPQPTSSASLTEQGAVVTFSPQASMGGPPPSVAGVEGQKAEGKADSVSVGGAGGHGYWSRVEES